MEKKLNMEKGFPDFSSWSPPLVLREKTESGEGISWISVVGVPPCLEAEKAQCIPTRTTISLSHGY